MSMVIISIALTGVFTVMNLTVRHSADPIINHQAIAIAESYMEEVLLQAYAAGGYSGSDRSQFDDVDDYNGLSDDGVKDNQGIDVMVKDDQGNLVAILSNYNVAISVASPVILTGSVAAKKVTVSVAGVGTTVSLVGYRANY